VLKWLERPTDGLLLCGFTGTGKTHMAAAIVRVKLEAGERVLFKRASEFYSAIRKSYNAPVMNEDDVMREYARSPLLVLDDLGAGSLSDHERRCTLELLDNRLDAMRPTVVTTNWTIEQIGERMDERIASRLSGFVVMAFTGRDLRVARKIAEGN
jgi:DNA replication protein DnaC